MDYAVSWDDLPKDLVVVVAHRLSFLEEFIQFTAVCKSWKSATDAHKPLWLPTRCPMLLLAEDVAPGAIRFAGIIDQDFSGTNEDDGDDDDDEHKLSSKMGMRKSSYDYSKNSIGTSRGLYSLLSTETYKIELPEAAGRLVLGTNKGWLVTLGRDLQINLLHPLLRHQFSLPPMLTFPRQYKYHENYTPEEAADQFIQKVAMSSRSPTCNTDGSISHHCATSSPVVMVVYGKLGFLGFARLGDKVWTDVNVPSHSFEDVIYHRGNFYAVNNQGDVYVCRIDDVKERGGAMGTKIASVESHSCFRKYLVEPLSGSGLLLLVRYSKIKYIEHEFGLMEVKYCTINFAVWRLVINYNDSVETPSCTLTEVNNLGNEAIFVGRASSLSVSSSEIIKPNSIYFTDDNWENYIRKGGGDDTGIFDMERRTIEPHFPGKSIHPISPPLWYI